MNNEAQATAASERPTSSTYASPDRIWLQETTDGDGLDMFWYSARPDGTIEPDLINPAVEYILRTTHDAELTKLQEALATCAIPYEALLADGESRKWIAPEVWSAIESACAAAREAMGEK